jgi:shikimate 5-dehydrogenase
VADESASRCGAVNTVSATPEQIGRFKYRRRRIFTRSSQRVLNRFARSASNDPWRGGGTGHAIAWQCALENCERLVLVNRTLAKTSAIVDRLRPFFAEPRVLGPVARLEAVRWDETAVRAQLADIDLIVNATPLGMNPSDPAPIPARLLAPHHIVFDCVYRPSKTALLRAADEAGARGANGLSMLLHQGAVIFDLVQSRSTD